MRWFKDEAYEAYFEADDEAVWNAMLATYYSHIASIADRLPPDLAALASEPRLNLHDARFDEVRVDRDAATADMRVVVGDLGLRLHFGEAAFVPDNLQLVAYAVGASFATDHWGTTRTVIMAQEVDITSTGRYLLRLRLWPFYEFAIEFGSFSLIEEPAPHDDDQPGAFLLAGDEADE